MRTPKTTRSLQMETNSQKSIFLPDTNYKIKNIDKRKVFMHKILQNLKYLGPNNSTNNGTKRIYAPPAASEFKFQIPEAKKQIKTPNSKSPDFKSKVSKDTQSVNILQCASDDLVSRHKGEGPKNCYTPNEWSVTVTTIPSNPFNQGQRTSESLLPPDQSELTTGSAFPICRQSIRTTVLLPPFLLDAQMHT